MTDAIWARNQSEAKTRLASLQRSRAESLRQKNHD